MEDKFYVTDSLYYYNGKTYFESENKDIKLNNSNWFKYLKEYGWEKLPMGWRKRLKQENSNSCYGLLECGADGDCLFHVIAEALNNSINYNNNILDSLCYYYDAKNIREIAANQINKNNFRYILENYKIEKENMEFNGDWEPNDIKTIKNLKDEIKKEGNNFWGDHIILQLLQDKLEFNTIILNSEKLDANMDSMLNLSIEKRFTVHPTGDSLDRFDRTIILYYIDGLHFQLVGYFDGNKMLTMFEKNELPKELLDVYCNDTNTTEFISSNESKYII